MKLDTSDSLHVPSLLEENTRLICDPNIQEGESGKLYMAEKCFYDVECTPEYALTVHPDIYLRVLREINDSKSFPCGFYFCCHGGDSAHSGTSHEDYVDIRFAILLVSLLMALMIFITYIVPVVDNEQSFM